MSTTLKRSGSPISAKNQNLDKYLDALQKHLKRTQNFVTCRGAKSRKQFLHSLESVYAHYGMDDIFEQLSSRFEKTEQSRYFQKLWLALNEQLGETVATEHCSTDEEVLCVIAQRFRDFHALEDFYEIVNQFQFSDRIENFEKLLIKVEAVLNATVAQNSPVADPSQYFGTFGLGVTSFLDNKELDRLSRTGKSFSSELLRVTSSLENKELDRLSETGKTFSSELLRERRIWVFPGVLPADLTYIHSLRIDAIPTAALWANLKRMTRLQSLEVTTTLSEVCELPESLRVLRFTATSKLTKSLKVPVNLAELTLPPEFNLSLFLPERSQLTHLEFGKAFNQQVVLPPNLTLVKFGSRFNHPLQLPPQLTHFTVGKHFQQAPQLPSTLTHLTVVGNYYPVWSATTALTHLSLSGDGKETPRLPRAIPATLHSLSIYNYPHTIPALPDGLKKFTVHSIQHSISEIYPHSLPERLKILKLHCVRGILDIPEECLEVLELGDNYNESIFLPDTLKKLRLGNSFNQEIKLPPGLLELSLGDNFNQPLTLPDTLTKLRIGAKFDERLRNIENTRLTQLILGNAYSQHFYHRLPPTLLELTMGFRFHQDLHQVLPRNRPDLIVRRVFW